MPRFFVPELLEMSDCYTLRITGDNARHGKDVLRLRPGDKVTVCDGVGTDYTCAVEALGTDFIDLVITSRNNNQAEPEYKVHLFHALMKADKMELTAQKAVELGVCGLWSFQSEHSVARLGNGAAGKAVRLRKIIESAAKQSGRGIIPNCHEATDFSQALLNAKNLMPELMLAAHEKAKVSLKERLTEGFKAPQTGKNIVVFIGPEGGFSDAEIQIFEDNHILTFSMGRRILRAETAGIAALCCCLYELEV